MPAATDLRQRTRIVLKTDADLPKDKQPAFIYRRLTGTEAIDLAELVDGCEEDSPREAVKKAFGAVMIGLVGLANITDLAGKEVKFGEEVAWGEILSIPEAMELAHRNYDAQEIDAEAKKKSDSQSDSDTEKSVETAEDLESAKTSQTPSSQ